MNKILLLFLIIFSISFGQSQTNSNLPERYKNEILPQEELLITARKTIEYVQNDNYESFKNLFIQEIVQNTANEQFVDLLNKLKLFLSENDIPESGDITTTLSFNLNGADTLVVNKVLYKFNNDTNDVLAFSFLKKHGFDKLVGLNLDINPFKANADDIKIKPISNFDFNIKNIEYFRIYYSEKKPLTKKFKNTLGIFAIEGNAQKLSDSKLINKFKDIFKYLRQSTFERKEIFNSPLHRGKNPEFIQVRLKFKDSDDSIFLYLPIENGEIYNDYILLQQEQYANLGYRYYIEKTKNKELINVLVSIIKMDLENYLEENP